MHKTVILILDKRKELGTKYKKTLEQINSSVFLVEDYNRAFEILLKYEPDLILISDNYSDNFGEFVQKIRIFTQHYRPSIVYLSKSSLLDDKLKILDDGADDYISEPIDIKEFKARIKAHLRHIIEMNLFSLTSLSNNKLSMVVLKRVLNSDCIWASMLISVENFIPYKEIYGQIAAEKMIQTYVAIINSCLADEDFLGQLSETEFLIITKTDKAEKIAAFLIFAFDTVADKFYSQKDAQNKYVTIKNDSSTEEKIGLVCTKIGIVTNENKKYSNITSVVNNLIATHKLTRSKNFSNYAVDRVKLFTGEITKNYEYNDRVMIVEPDESLCFLLSETAKLQGYNVDLCIEYSNLINKLNEFNPAVLIMDVGNIEDKSGIIFCEKIKSDNILKKIKIIMTSNIHNKDEILTCGADIYLPKPYDLLTIYSWVSKLVKKYNF